MLKSKMFKRFGAVIMTAALVISSQAVNFAQESEYPELAASWDFTESTNSGFTVKNYDGGPLNLEISDSRGKMTWNSYICTNESFSNAVLEFDYMLNANKPNDERRINVYFGVSENDIKSGNYVYIDFIKDIGDKPHIVVDGADWGYFNEENDYKFHQDTVYNFRYAINGDSVRIWAKAKDETSYTYIGERSGLNIPSGKISFNSHDWGYIDNIKIYSQKVDVSVKNGEYISADTKNITVKLINNVEINNSNVTLKKNGSLIACEFVRSGNDLTIIPAAIEADSEYTLWLSEEITGESGGKTITFNTMPDLAASYDFATGDNKGFIVTDGGYNGSSLPVENGAGKLWWERYIFTEKNYQNAIVEFDYKYTPVEKDNQFKIWFGVNGTDDSACFSYIDISKDGGAQQAHFVSGGVDGFLTGGQAFEFSKDTYYTLRYVVSGDSVKLFAKKTGDPSFTYAGERTGITVPGGRVKIYNREQFAYIKNLKVYANTAEVSVMDGETVPAELKSIIVKMPKEVSVDNSNIKLTQNGNNVGYTIAQNGRVLTINPVLKPQKEYVLRLSEKITGEAGGITIAFNTMPSLTAYYDLTNNINNGFNNPNSFTVSGGEGKMSWDTTIITNDSYKNAILDFDYRLESYKGETRFKVCFGADENGDSANFFYVDINGASQPAFHRSGVDYSFNNGHGFVFKDSVTYSFRYVLNDDCLKFYAKEADAEDYTFVGEVSNLNIPRGRMSINGKEYGYIKNLKVYGYITDRFDYVIKNASYNRATKQFTADIEALSGNAAVAQAAIASYSQGCLSDVKVVSVSDNTAVNETIEAADEYKIMVFDGFDNIKPVAEYVEFN